LHLENQANPPYCSTAQPPSHDHCDYKDELNELLSCLEDRHSTDEPEHASHSFLHQNTAAPSHPSSSYFSRDSTGAFSEHQHTGNKPFAEEVGDKNRAEGQGDLDLASAMQVCKQYDIWLQRSANADEMPRDITDMNPFVAEMSPN
jgi:hypothetical protein